MENKEQNAQNETPVSKRAQKPRSASWDENYIEEFFKSIGIPIKNTTNEKAGTTSIITLHY